MPTATYLIILAVLAFQVGIVRSHKQPQQFLMGESEGVRYYFDPWPKGMRPKLSKVDSREVNGINCTYTRPFMIQYPGTGRFAWLYTVSDIRGSRQFYSSGEIGGETCFETFESYEWKNRTVKRLAKENPVVTTANSLCAGGELVLSMAAEEPAPNGVYYGFSEDGFEATIKFDGRSRIKEVRVNDPQGEVTKLIFTMIGKAIKCYFGIPGETRFVNLIVEPVDPTKFDGTKESFHGARLNTMVGQPFDRSHLRRLFGLKEPGKLKRMRSRIARSITSIRKPGAFLHRRTMRDGMEERLLAQDDTDLELDNPATMMADYVDI